MGNSLGIVGFGSGNLNFKLNPIDALGMDNDEGPSSSSALSSYPPEPFFHPDDGPTDMDAGNGRSHDQYHIQY